MAIGDTLVVFTPASYEPPTTDPARPNLVNGHLVLDFQRFAPPSEIAVFRGVMPQHYGGGTIVVYLHYTMSSATSGNIEFTCSFQRMNEADNIITDSFGTEVITGSISVPGTAGFLDVTTTTHDIYPERDSIADSDAFALKVQRSNVVSDANSDLELWRVELREA